MWAVVVLCVVYIVVGFVFSRQVKNATDFLIAGRQLPFVYLVFTIAGTHFGGGVLMGGIQWGAEKGVWPGMYSGIGLGLASLVSMLVAGKLREKSHNITPPDFMESRYGHSMFLRGYHASVYILGTIAIIAVQFMAFGQAAQAFGLPYSTAVVVGTVTIVLYTYMAGMWGVAVTSVIQFGVCAVALPILVVYGLHALQQKEAASVGQLLSAPFFPSPHSVGEFLYTTLPSVLGSLFAYEYFLRWQSAKDARSVNLSCALAGVLLVLIAVPVGMLGAIGARLFPGVEPGRVMATMTIDVLPPAIGMLFLAVVLSAIASTADSLMTSLGGMVSRDIYHKLLNPHRRLDDLKYSLLLAKVASAVGAALGCAIALRHTSILDVLFWPSPLQSGTLFVPFIGGLFWKGATRAGAMAAIVVGALMALLDMTGLYAWPERMLFPIGGALLAFVAISKLTTGRRPGAVAA